MENVFFEKMIFFLEILALIFENVIIIFGNFSIKFWFGFWTFCADIGQIVVATIMERYLKECISPRFRAGYVFSKQETNKAARGATLYDRNHFTHFLWQANFRLRRAKTKKKQY